MFICVFPRQIYYEFEYVPEAECVKGVFDKLRHTDNLIGSAFIAKSKNNYRQ